MLFRSTQFDKYSIILITRITYDIIIQDNNNDYGINKYRNNKINDKIINKSCMNLTIRNQDFFINN